MRFHKSPGVPHSIVLMTIILTGIATFGSIAGAQFSEAPNPGASAVEEPVVVAKTKKHVAHRVLKRATKMSEAAVPQPAPPAAPPQVTQPAQDKGSIQSDFTAQLDKAGASACRGQVNALAKATMEGVVKYNTMSNWSKVAGDKRAVSLAIGQKYADGSAVPFSLSQVISAPNQQGTCDSFALQVFPSPLSCGKLRDTIAAAHGQQIGDLAGIPLMQDGTTRTMLVPTTANTCVLIATRSIYAK